nr:hypothetical protein [Erysipelotrichaceae bacterium]
LEVFDEWMAGLGVGFTRSYAAPRGMYCQDLGKALRDKGYRHSRDFGYAVDDHPFFPYCEGVQESVLQIPCDGFNICRWMLKNRDEGLPMPKAEEIIDSYRKLIDLKMRRDQPLLFFCHPQYFGLYAREVYPQIVAYAREKGAVTSDYVAYGDFWIERDRCVYDADLKDHKLIVKKEKWSDAVRLSIDGKIVEEGREVFEFE